MKQEHKIYAGVALLVALGSGVYLTRTGAKEDEAKHTVTAAQDLPKVQLAKEEAEAVTKFVIKNADKGEVTLEKKGEDWVLTKPLEAKANQQNVKSIVENLEKIELQSVIASTADVHEKYELDDTKSVHIEAFKGGDKVFDAIFGKSGSRGQMMRLPGKDVVYSAKGYSSYIWAREVKNWRDNEVLTFDDANAVGVEVENDSGHYGFTKADDKWKSSYKKRDKGKLEGKGDEIERFDDNKVKDLLRAYKSLKSTDFAADGVETGVDAPLEHEGGIVRIKLKDGAKHVINVGKKQEGSNRYAVKEGGDGTAVVITSWAADWAIAKADKFQKAEGKSDAGTDDEGDEGDEGDDHEHGDEDDGDAKKSDAKKGDAKKGDAKKSEPKKGEPKKSEPKKSEPKKSEPKKSETKPPAPAPKK